MQISEIKSDIYFLCGANSATYPSASITRNINIAYADVARIIWENAAGWQYDDTNKTTLPVAKTTLTHGTRDYTLPTDAQRLRQVEVKDINGNWSKLKPWDPSDTTFAVPEFYETAGLPQYYDLVGRNLSLIPAPASGSVTLASGVAVYVDRDVTNFAATATTSEPGFAAPFHRILSYAAALDFTKDEADRRNFMLMKSRLEQGLVKFYQRRMTERKTRISPQTKSKWRRYT